MRRLTVFNNVTLDAFIATRDGDFSFARHDDSEWNEFIQGNARGGSEMLFGRITYDVMVQFWPTPEAQNMPVVADAMNNAPKVVFSRTMTKADWKNTRIVRSDIEGEVARMKSQTGPAMIIFGSGQIVGQLADAGLIDEYRLAVNPVALGTGKAMFGKRPLNLKRRDVRTFTNGVVLETYERG